MEQTREYKCLNCGRVRESSVTCTCSECGFKMFPTPYNRREVIVGEIKFFIDKLQLNDISVNSFDYAEKEKDDNRFPGFDAIKKYAFSAEKTEKYISRINQSIEQIDTYAHSSLVKIYKVKSKSFEEGIDKRNAVLAQAVKIVFDKELSLAEFKMPEYKLHYSEVPNALILPYVERIFPLLNDLTSKVAKFIKQNNMYGKAHQIKVNDSFKQKKDKDGNPIEIDYVAELNKVQQGLETIIAKKYVVDIFDDGSAELKEMLTYMWSAIAMIMRAPLFNVSYEYEDSDGKIIDKDEFLKKVASMVSSQYESVNVLTGDENSLSDMSEESLFEKLAELIKIDEFRIFGADKTKLTVFGECEKKLNQLIGLSSIKESILKIKAYALANKGSEVLNLHMCFEGNPGTGKTEVARIIAGILHENGILPSSKVVETDRSGLIGQYVGETPQKTMRKINEAMGGVLFVDEAYALVPEDGSFDYGHEAVATLIKAMEDYRGKFCVILAGYRNEMEKMISSNPGFKSRIQFTLDFQNYSRDELGQITDLMLNKRNYTLTAEARSKILDVTDVARKSPNFANAREIRNILDQVIMCQNLRVAGTQDRELGIIDVNKYIKDSNIAVSTAVDNDNKILTADDELDALVGLSNVKRMVKKVRAYAKRNMDSGDFNMHMCFYGNPGTGKTEVARIISRLLYDAGVLPEAKVVETDVRGLIGKYVGETAPKTQNKINDAMGGVLFIDEAYSLSEGSHEKSYGEEAIAVLLKEMEDKRGKFCVILAGYKNEMQNMIATNPGFESRIQFSLDFPDYTRDELGEIANLMLAKKKYSITEEALNKLLDVADWFSRKPNFANARTIRNILDQVIMNQNLRVEDESDNYEIIIDDVLDYISDEGIDLSEKKTSTHFGFKID